MGLIVATTARELEAVPVHDAWCNPDDLVHNHGERTLTIPFAQDPDPSANALQPELVRRRWLWTEYRAPLVGWRLTVFNAQDIQGDEGWADMGMLVGLSYDGDKHVVTLHSNGKLEVTVDRLHVEASGGDEVIAWSRRRVWRLGAVSDTRSR